MFMCIFHQPRCQSTCHRSKYAAKIKFVDWEIIYLIIFTYFRKPLIPSPPQKHYKIVFIKAPIPPTTPTPSIPPLQVNEEKTIIYVLVKKIEQAPDIVIPTPASTPLSKPEVYFIRYKTETEEGGGADTGGGYGKSMGPLKPDDYLGPSIPVETDDSDDSHKHKH